MYTKRQQNKAFLKLLFASMFIHGSAIVGYLLSLEVQESTPQQKAVKVQLRVQQPSNPQKLDVQQPEPPQQEPEQQKVVEQQPQEPESHLPSHNSDEVASNNQNEDVDGEIVAGGGNEGNRENIAEAKQSPRPQEHDQKSEVSESASEEIAQEQSKKEAREIVTTVGPSVQAAVADGDGDEEPVAANNSASRALEEFNIDALPSLEELTIPGEFLEGIGNLELLSDGELSDTIVEQPFSENESKELQLVNRYLARMNKQVLSFWINPYKGNQLHRGIIKVELSSSGYLEDAYIYRSSGHSLLDISVLDAIRAVPRYEVPDNEIITARYYTNLSFHYSSIEEETELMPFEQEREEVN